jgi:predicted nucleic acid-binding protein
MDWLRPKLVVAKFEKFELVQAKKRPVHYPDCIHLYLAEKYEAIIVSNDLDLLNLGAILARTL